LAPSSRHSGAVRLNRSMNSELQAQARFLGKLLERVGSLRRLVKQSEPPNDRASAEPARREAHNLAGTSGSYGLQQVSQRARDLEELLDRVVQGDVPPSDWTRITDAVNALTHEAEAAHRPTLESDPAPDGPTSARPRILFADADPDARHLAEDVGARSLWRVITVDNAAEALNLASSECWDAVLLGDTLDGDEQALGLARELRSIPRQAEVPMAVMSARTSMETRVNAARAGVSMFLAKPVSRNGLTDSISTLVAMRRATMPRVLAVDDDPDFLEQLGEVLRNDGIEVHAITDSRQILEAIRDRDPDALLLDYDMPDFNGIELCATVRADRRTADLPIMFVSAHGDDATRLAAFTAGCDDYLHKPSLSSAELRARLRSRVDRSRRMRARADRDGLTGLSQRRVFVADLETRLSEAIRRELPLTVCLVDLDHFKRVNDQYGHLTGDRVLAAFGRLLSSRFRGEDLRARWGGEEFALAFPGEDADTIRGIMQRVLEEFTRRTFRGDHDETFHVSFSAGLAAYPVDGDTVESLLGAADERLIQAKKSGRCRVEVRSDAD
ncbi:MAG: diguanylate cyclase, partial [Myxococcota bacterium]